MNETFHTGSNIHTAPKRRDLPYRLAGNDVLVSDPETKRVHFLNPTAAVVWECCDGATTIDACEKRLRNAFNIPPDADVRADILAVLVNFSRQGLLDG